MSQNKTIITTFNIKHNRNQILVMIMINSAVYALDIFSALFIQQTYYFTMNRAITTCNWIRIKVLTKCNKFEKSFWSLGSVNYFFCSVYHKMYLVIYFIHKSRNIKLNNWNAYNNALPFSKKHAKLLTIFPLWWQESPYRKSHNSESASLYSLINILSSCHQNPPSLIRAPVKFRDFHHSRTTLISF